MIDPTARICCLDLDTFFVSVERLLDPSLIGKPVVVGGRAGSRGVVTAASYEVREFGVRSGMSMTDAQRLAPHATYLPTRHGVYSPYAKQVRQILDRYTPIVRTASIDEFYLDFRGCEALYRHKDDATDDATISRVVWQMRDGVQAELGLPSSVGIGATRIVAKIASGLAKPAGVFMVPVGQELTLLSPLPVRKFPGIGPVAESRLLEAGIKTLGMLVELPPGPLRERFGKLAGRVRRGLDGRFYHRLAVDRPAFLEYDPSGAVGSISNERTFYADIGDETKLAEQLCGLAERVCWRARKRGVRARTVTLKLRYSDFQTITRSRTDAPTSTESVVYATALMLLDKARTRRARIRLLGLALSNLIGEDRQLLLPFPDVGVLSPGAAIDRVRARFGYDAIRLGAAARKTRWLTS